MADVERVLNSLRRMPENRACGTCKKEDRFGHKNVCMKFRIFICSECKSAHQAFSHKCKSVTMSNWTTEEVELLKAPHGGNAANAATIFAKLAKDSDAYPQGCNAKEVKEFVNLAYNDLRWAGKAAVTSAEPPKQSDVPPPVASVQSAPDKANFDLLSAFDSPPPVTAVRTAPVTPSMNLFEALDAQPPELRSATFDVPSFDALSQEALSSGTNFFEAFESAPSASPSLPAGDLVAALAASPSLPAGDLVAALAFETFESAPAVSAPAVCPPPLGFDAFGSFKPASAATNNDDLFGSFESADEPAFDAAFERTPPKAAARAMLLGEEGAASPSSVLDEPALPTEPPSKRSGAKGGHVSGGVMSGSDLFSKFMTADLMATSMPSEPMAAPTAKVATPMAKMATPMAKMATPPMANATHAMMDPPPPMMGTARAPLGADFVDLSAMRGPRAFKSPMHAPMHAPMHTPMHGMHMPMRPGM